MSTTVTSTNSRRLDPDQLSLLAVCIVTIVALLLGAALRSSVENRSQHIEQKGFSASVPANWTVEDGAADLIFVSWDPFVPDVRYTVYLVSNEGDHPLTEVSAERNTALSKSLEGFRVLEETPVIRRGREGYKVTYAFVDSDVPGLPTVVQAVDYYFPASGKAMVISLQAHSQDYEEALLRFEAFLDSVSYKPGE